MTSDKEPTAVEMLESMRVAELQQILYHAYQQRFGRKSMLIERCVSLLQTQGPTIEEKIKEVYHRRHIIPTGIPRPVIRLDRSRPLTNRMFVRSHLKFVPLAFYDFIEEILGPVNLYSNEELNTASVSGTEVHPMPGNHQMQLQFHLSPQEAQDVATSRYWCEETQSWTFSLNIQLRFCVADKKQVEAEDSLPPNLYVLVNNRVVNLPMPRPTSKPNAEVLRPGRPIDLTEHCSLSPTLCNLVEVGWSTGLSAESPLTTYCAAIFLVRKLNVDTLICRLKLEGTFDAEVTKSLIRKKLICEDRSSGVLQITTNTLYASFLCPLSKCRMELPARTVNCRHVQCFDLQVFLRMNEKRPTWTCPVCDNKAPYQSLLIDWFLFDVIGKCPDVDAVEFDKDCNYVPVNSDVKPKKQKKNPIPEKVSDAGHARKKAATNSEDVVIIVSDDETADPKEQVEKDQLVLLAKYLECKNSKKDVKDGVDSDNIIILD